MAVDVAVDVAVGVDVDVDEQGRSWWITGGASVCSAGVAAGA